MTVASDRSLDYERSDAEPRLIAALAAGIAAFLLLSPALLHLLFPDAARQTVTPAHWADIAQPRLQLDPSHDLAAFRRSEERRLSSYGWIDRERNLVHLPIDRASSLILKRGLPGWRMQ